MSKKKLGFHTEYNFGHKGNLSDVFFGLAQVAQLLSELFALWRVGKLAIDQVGSKRRYFERLAIILGSQALEEDDEPILYLKFEFNSS